MPIESPFIEEKRLDPFDMEYKIDVPLLTYISKHGPEVCLEKTLMRLESDIAEILAGKQDISQERLEGQLHLLQQQCSDEGLWHPQVQEALKTLQQSISSEERDGIKYGFQSLSKILCPIRVDIILKRCHAAQSFIKPLAGKQVTFVIGTTGVGKSTLMHVLMGSDFEEIQVEGLKHIQPHMDKRRVKHELSRLKKEDQDINEDKLRSTFMKTSPQLGISQTDQVHAVEIWYESYGSNLESLGWFCDTAGFDDQRGPEIDISNMLSLVEALKSCAKVRFVLLLDLKAMGSKLNTLEPLITMWTDIHPGIVRHISSFDFVFRVSEHETYGNICNQLINFLKNKGKDIGQTTKSLLSKMITKARNEKIGLFNPLNKHSNDDLFDFLTQDLKNSEKFKLLAPDGYAFSVAEASRKKISQQARYYLQSIDYALTNANYDLVCYRMEQLKDLALYLNDHDLKNYYREARHKVADFFRQFFNTQTQLFKKLLHQDNRLEKEDVKHYHRVVQVAGYIDFLKNTHYENKAQSNEDRDDIIGSPAFLCVVGEVVEIMSRYFDPGQMVLTDQRTKAYLDKMHLLNSYFPDVLGNRYLDAQQLVATHIQKLIDAAQTALEHQYFEVFSRHLSELKKVTSDLKSHISDEQSNTYNSLQNQCFSQIDAYRQKVEQSLQTSGIHDQTISLITQFAEIVQQAKKVPELHAHIDFAPINRCQKVISETLIAKFSDAFQQAQRLLSQNDLGSDTLKASFVTMKDLKMLDTIQHNISKDWDAIHLIMHKKIITLSKDVTQLSSDWLVDGKTIDKTALTTSLEQLNDAQWFRNFEKHSEVQGFNDIGRVEGFIQHTLHDLQALMTQITQDAHHRLSAQLSRTHNLQNVCFQKFLQFEGFFEKTSLFRNAQNDYRTALDTFLKQLEYFAAQVESTMMCPIASEYEASPYPSNDLDDRQSSYSIESLFEPSYSRSPPGQASPLTQGAAFSREGSHPASDIDTFKAPKEYYSLDDQKKYDVLAESKTDSLYRAQNKLSTLQAPLSVQEVCIIMKWLGFTGSIHLKSPRFTAFLGKIQNTKTQFMDHQREHIQGCQRICTDACLNLIQLAKDLERGNAFDQHKVQQYVNNHIRAFKTIRMWSKHSDVLTVDEDRIDFEEILKMISDELNDLIETLHRHIESADEFAALEQAYAFKTHIEPLRHTIKDRHAWTRLGDIYFRRLRECTGEIFQEFYSDLGQGLYQQADVELNTLLSNKRLKKGSRQYHKVQSAIHCALKNCQGEVSRSLRALKSQQDSQLDMAESWSHLKGIEPLTKYLSDEEQQDYASAIKRIKTELNDDLKKKNERIEHKLKHQHFFEAHQIAKHIKRVRNEVPDMVSEEMSRHQEVDIQQSLTDMISKYEQQPFDAWGKNTEIQAIYQTLNRLSLEDPSYEDSKNQLKNSIQSKFDQQFQTIENEIKRTDQPAVVKLEGLNGLTDQLEKVLPYVPDTMQSHLSQKVTEYRTRIDQEVQQNLVLVKKALNCDDASQLRQRLDEMHQHHPHGANSLELEGKIMAKFKELANELVATIRSHSFQNLDLFNRLTNYIRHLDFLEMRTISQSIKTCMGQTIHELLQTIKQPLHSDDTVLLNNRVLEPLIFRVQELTALTYLSQYLTQTAAQNPSDLASDILSLFFPHTVQHDLQDMCQWITDLICQHHHSYQTAVDLKQTNLETLRHHILKARCLNPLYETLNTYVSECQKCGQDSLWSAKLKKLEDALKKLWRDHHILKASLEAILNAIQSLSDHKLINDETRYTEHQRQKFYEDFCTQWKQYKSFSSLKDLDPQFGSIEQQYAAMTDQWNNEAQQLVQEAQTILKKPSILKIDYQRIYLILVNLEAWYNNAKQSLKLHTTNFAQDIHDAISYQITSLEQTTLNALFDEKRVIQFMLQLEGLATGIPSFREPVNNSLQRLCDTYKDQHGDVALFALGGSLTSDRSGLGMSIVKNPLLDFPPPPLPPRHTIDHVIKHLKSDYRDQEPFEKEWLQQNWQFVQEADQWHFQPYQNYLNQYLRQPIDTTRLIREIKSHVFQASWSSTPVKIHWSYAEQEQALQMMAGILALWTVHSARYYFKAMKAKQLHPETYPETYLKIPHATQITAIVAMLRLYTPQHHTSGEDFLKNHLAEILTGEGKSLVIATIASVLALIGCEVYCACYSSYLSQRDQEDFKWMFEALGIQKQITYGTFQTLCEKVINDQGNIRDLVRAMIASPEHYQKGVESSAHTEDRLPVLIIDEVDVLFSEEFYGNTYIPSAKLKDPTITQLIEYVWAHRDDFLRLSDVKRSTEYQACCQRFQGWESLIQEATKDLLFDVQHFHDHHHYVIHEDRIAYKVQDSVRFDVTEGYRTLFAALYEIRIHQQISDTHLDELLHLNIRCGNFPYAKLPHEHFHLILGTTGTLQVLGQPVKDLIHDQYRILKAIYPPSVFPESQRAFRYNQDVVISNDNDYFLTILNVIKTRRSDHLLENGQVAILRPVIVFFKDETTLEMFYTAHMKPFRHDLQKMTEKLTFTEKEAYVKHATSSGTITLALDIYTRGTDFTCQEHAVKTHGGPHVLTTYWPEKKSDRTQAIGRTGRQGGQGSFSMVLKESELRETLDIDEKDMHSIRQGSRIFGGPDLYTDLEKRSETIFSEKFQACITAANNDDDDYEESKTFHDQLVHRKSLTAKLKYLLKLNQGVDTEAHIKSRTLVFMDATGSMYNMINACKQQISKMFNQLFNLLKESSTKESFMMQFAVYRNYNSSKEEILESSSWEQNPNKLQDFLNGIHSKGGWGHEALEIALQDVNQQLDEVDITQVVVIGDAPANTEEDVKRKRQESSEYGQGESYWNNHLGAPTFFRTELNAIKQKNPRLTIHTFYVDERARNNFQEIAGSTEGRCQPLDLDSDRGAEALTDVVNRCVAWDIGGPDLENKYCQMYMG